VAERLLALANGTLPWPWIDADRALPWIERRTGLTFAESQKAAVRLALIAKVLVITGGPGVEKTTIVNSILRIHERLRFRRHPEQRCGPPAARIVSRTGDN
jgi:exodeoxyribonuclease V alpha subunit